MKTAQCEPSCSMRTESWTDMMKPLVAYRNFVNAPKNERKLTKFIDSLRNSGSKGRCRMECNS